MPNQVIGSCSICGGDVEGWVGPYWSTVPPPPPKCRDCGAVSAAHKPVIPMRPERVERHTRRPVRRDEEEWVCHCGHRGGGPHGCVSTPKSRRHRIVWG